MDSPSATLQLFPATHSCEFCQCFVLDPYNEIDWGPESTDSRLKISRGKKTIKPSLRVQEWFDKDEMFRSRNSRSHMRAVAEHNFTLVFDCTLLELKHAASKGCALSQYLLRDIKAEVPTSHWDATWEVEDDNLFAAQFSSNSDSIQFGMATHTYQYEVNASPFGGGTEDEFAMFAHRSKLPLPEAETHILHLLSLLEHQFCLA